MLPLCPIADPTVKLRLQDLNPSVGPITFAEKIISVLRLGGDLFENEIASMKRAIADHRATPTAATAAALWAAIVEASDTIGRYVDSKDDRAPAVVDAFAQLGDEIERLRES